MNALRKYDILDNYNECDIHILRKKSEEIRNDPFDLGNTVKGLTYLNHEKNLSIYALQLVGQYAKYSHDQYELSLEMLPEEDQNELSRLYIESIDREIEWACYGEDQSINSSFLCALLSLLKNDNEETREKFAEITRKNVLTYYKNTLQEILDNACHEYYFNEMNESGYHSQYDSDNGDLVWRC